MGAGGGEPHAWLAVFGVVALVVLSGRRRRREVIHCADIHLIHAPQLSFA